MKTLQTSVPNIQPRRSRQSGFTLVELMITVSILGVLAALASPSFAAIIERYRVRQAAEELQSTLQFARSEAIKRGGRISIIKTTDDALCKEKTAWGCGWTVFVDTNNDGSQNSGEDTLQVIGAFSRVDIDIANSDGFIKVDGWGQLASKGSKLIRFGLVPRGFDNSRPSAIAICTGAGGMLKRLAMGSDSC